MRIRETEKQEEQLNILEDDEPDPEHMQRAWGDREVPGRSVVQLRES